MAYNMRIISLILFLLISNSVTISNISRWNDTSEIDNITNENDKIRMIYFQAEWCKWCRKMENEVFSDVEVKNYIEKHFLLINADLESRKVVEHKNKYLTIKQLAELFNVKTFPAIVFMDSNQESIGEITGYYEKEEFLKVLRYVNDLVE
jgi:thioredoxin-related protein